LMRDVSWELRAFISKHGCLFNIWYLKIFNKKVAL
jgi:hypothetical protein